MLLGIRDLVPKPGIKHTPSALEAWSLNQWTTREVPTSLLFVYTILPRVRSFLFHVLDPIAECLDYWLEFCGVYNELQICPRISSRFSDLHLVQS